MSPTLILLRKSLLNFSRARGAVVITFAVPIVLIYLFGHVFGLYRKDTGPLGIPVAVVNASSEPVAKELIDALRAEKSLHIITEKDGPNGTKLPLTEADVRAALHDNDYRFALILPADLYSDQRIGVRMKFLSNPRNDIEAQTVNGLVQKTVFTKVPQLLGQSLERRARNYLGAERFDRFNTSMADTISSNFGGDREEIRRRIAAGDYLNTTEGRRRKPDPTLRRLDVAAPTSNADATKAPAVTDAASDDSTDVFSRIVKIEVEQVAGKEVKNPMAARIVGGYAIMFLLFAVSGTAASLFEERNSGVFQRLLASPVRPKHILWSRFYFGVILGLVQISALFLAGRLFFGLEIFSHAVALFAVALSAAAACSAFGMLIAAVSSNASAANGLATFVVISMSAVGGAWFPTSFMPDYIQTVSKLTLVYWSVEGFTDVLWAGRSFIEVLPKVGILTGMAAVVMLVSVWRFNRSKLFE
jgi:ABC-2 type transport system permease protein